MGSDLYVKHLINAFEPYEGNCLILAFAGYENDLQEELKRRHNNKIIWQKGSLFYIEGYIQPAIWAQAHLLHPQKQAIKSIGEAQKILRQHHLRWNCISLEAHRRCQLIQTDLKTQISPTLSFRENLQTKSYGAWTLTDSHTLWLSNSVVAKTPLGVVQFKEDKTNPPSRAYLKLWELFTLYGYVPAPNSTVLDMGSCPGGWTWVLQKLGCKVISVDKAPLSESLNKLPNIQYIKKDAFALDPTQLGPIDCFFSDIICYPEKLYDLVTKWRESGVCKKFVCTVKFQGESDFDTLNKLAAIPDSKFIHLFVNKHEVTWINGFK